MQRLSFTSARRKFHDTLLETVLTLNHDRVASNADKDQRTSVVLAAAIINKLSNQPHHPRVVDRMAGQTSGDRFETACYGFLEDTFLSLDHLRPGSWRIEKVAGKNRLEIAKYEQYAHLVDIDKLAAANPELQAAIGSDYTITPDLVIHRQPEPDESINEPGVLVDEHSVHYAGLRRRNNTLPLLHASVSCKWTIRSDRAQNSRTEALNLVRNRKGHLPHIVVVTGEPTPSRLASLALGTGDIDCVYHFALGELQEAVQESENDEAINMLRIMVDGKRLKDVADLPLDLAV